ncbi:conserved domain protein [Actinomyces sp. oral taxon 170 str. F0386]|nr:conserved domain protein [Actinomyces sp. oral taxon 170 str. F0386]
MVGIFLAAEKESSSRQGARWWGRRAGAHHRSGAGGCRPALM